MKNYSNDAALFGEKGSISFFSASTEKTQCMTFVVPLQILPLNSCCGFLLFLGSSPFHHPEVLSLLKVTERERQPVDFLSYRSWMCISNEDARKIPRGLAGPFPAHSSSYLFFWSCLPMGLLLKWSSGASYSRNLATCPPFLDCGFHSENGLSSPLQFITERARGCAQ